MNNLRRPAAYRRELGGGTFSRILTQADSHPEITAALGPLLDQIDEAEESAAAGTPTSTADTP